MGMPSDIAIVDTMIGLPFKDDVWPEFISGNARRVLKLGQ
jgi:hypothetical protein